MSYPVWDLQKLFTYLLDWSTNKKLTCPSESAVFQNILDGTFWLACGLYSCHFLDTFAMLICTSTYFYIVRIIWTIYHGNIHVFGVLCCLLINNDSIFMMAVIMYVIGVATWFTCTENIHCCCNVTVASPMWWNKFNVAATLLQYYSLAYTTRNFLLSSAHFKTVLQHWDNAALPWLFWLDLHSEFAMLQQHSWNIDTHLTLKKSYVLCSTVVTLLQYY